MATYDAEKEEYGCQTVEEGGLDGYTHIGSPGEPSRGRWVVERFEVGNDEVIVANDWKYNKQNVVNRVLVVNPR